MRARRNCRGHEAVGGARRPAGQSQAYTLVEMLTVIAVIAVLASLVLAVLPMVREKRDKAVAWAQLRALTVAINDYKTDLNEYPPDNANDPARPPLFYELTGVSTDKAGRFTNEVSGHKGFSANPPFPQNGFRNTRADGGPGKNYYAELKPRQYAQPRDPSDPYKDYWFLVVPLRGPTPDFNPFHYVSTNPTNNPNSYDLWVDIVPRSKVLRIDNWTKY